MQQLRGGLVWRGAAARPCSGVRAGIHHGALLVVEFRTSEAFSKLGAVESPRCGNKKSEKGRREGRGLLPQEFGGEREAGQAAKRG